MSPGSFSDSAAIAAVEKYWRVLAGFICIVFLAGIIAALLAEPTTESFGFSVPRSSTLAAPLALLAALSWGSADYLAGIASRRSSALRIVVGVHIVGLIVLTVLSPLIKSSAEVSDLLWGIGGGVGGGLGTLLLYKGLAIGRMAVVAPVTAAQAAAIPVLIGLFGGDALGNLGLLGIGIAFPAVILIAMAPDDSRMSGPVSSVGSWIQQPGLTHALVGGIGFGAFYVCLDRTGGDTGVWPLLSARVASVVLLAVAAIVAEKRVLPSPDVRVATFFAGLLDVTAGVLFLLATRQGALSVASVLTSMYPAATVLLAIFLLGERCSKPQILGMFLSAIAIGLLVLN